MTKAVSVSTYRFAVVVAFLLGIVEGWLIWRMFQ